MGILSEKQMYGRIMVPSEAPGKNILPFEEYTPPHISRQPFVLIIISYVHIRIKY